MILVVGSTGQLGTAIVRRLAASCQPVRAFARPDSQHDHLRREGIEIALGDLLDSASLDTALKGIEIVIATANAIVPRGSDTPQRVEGIGYANLINACKQAKVKQFIFISTPLVPGAEHVPPQSFKRLNEQRLQDSGLVYTIFRPSMFMESWFALIGSRIPTYGEDVVTINRPFWFAQMFSKMTGTSIEQRGMAIILGGPDRQNAFISVQDIAAFVAQAVGHPQARNQILELGGPQVMTWPDVLDIYSRVLGRPVKASYTPPGVFRVMSALLRPILPRASNILGLNLVTSLAQTPFEIQELMQVFGVPRLKTSEEFLCEKAALAKDAADAH